MTKAGGMTNISKITFPWSEWFHCSLLTVQPHWRCYRCIWHCYRASKINFQSTYINLFKSLLDPPQVTGQHSRSPLEFSKFDVHGTQSISQLKIFGNDSFFTIKNFDYLLFAGFNEITPLCNLSVLTSFCQQIECKTSHFPSSSTVHIIHSMFQHFNFHLLFNCFLKSNVDSQVIHYEFIVLDYWLSRTWFRCLHGLGLDLDSGTSGMGSKVAFV